MEHRESNGARRGPQHEMHAICDSNNCTGCGACAVVCPVTAIEMREDREGFRAPAVLSELCVECGRCIEVCPTINPQPTEEGSFYMAWNTDPAVLERCSSGGMLDVLAAYVLERGGVVFGARLDQQTRILEHAGVDCASDLDALRRSKYFQSRTERAYGEVLKELKSGRWVLYTGTPCQVAGLLSLVGSERARERLLTMDVLCHGVTSKLAVDSYVESKEREHGAKALEIGFRCKRGKLGWAAGCGPTVLKLDVGDGLAREWVDEGAYGAGTFFAGYNRSLFLRESCYRCRYCSVARVSDFTAADFWGVDRERVGNWQYWHGVSLLLANTEKARNMLRNHRGVHLEAIDPQEALSRNGAFSHPAARPDLRDRVFEDLKARSFDSVVLGYYHEDIMKSKVKGVVKSAIGDVGVKAMKKLLRR